MTIKDSRLTDQNWLHQKRVVERLTYDEIGTILGVSRAPVIRSCKKLWIGDTRLTDKEWLYQKRVVEQLSYVSIGDILGVADGTVSRACKKFGFGDTNFSEVSVEVKAHLTDKEWLYQKRVVERLSYKDIGKLLGISPRPVNEACATFQIDDPKYKAKHEAVMECLSDRNWMYQKRVTEKKTLSAIADELGVDRETVTAACKALELPHVNHKRISVDARVSLDDYDWLWRKYKTECLTHKQIGEHLGISEEPVRDALVRFNIEANSRGVYNTGTSSAEQEIVDFIRSFYDGKVIESSRSLLGDGREVDIYIPEKKLAIEYNGVYFHLFRPEETIYSLRKDATYHVSKTDILSEKGVELIQIWSGDWETKKDIWKSRIKAKFGIVANKIHARKCEVREISSVDKNAFLNENHLQGQDRANTKTGLFHDGELVAVMTFIRADSYKVAEWELSRFATKNNTLVVGGFSKLLKNFRKANTGSVVSYADRMHSTGNVYTRNGFTLHHVNKPSYHYVKRGSSVLENRQKFMKYKIAEQGDTRTEYEIAAERGYSRIYDCGTLTYVLE